jgi:phospholipase/lecithinase/hemolysin
MPRTAAAMDAESSWFIRLMSVLLLCIAAPVWPILPVASQVVPASFSFGDSLGDPGNNNYIDSLSKANYPHNGIDFPAGPTGRFTNGRTIVDIVGEFLGLKNYLPPYMAPSTTGTAILNGVNYASGAAGILDSSGYAFIERISMNQQVAQFANTSAQIMQLLGPEAGANHIANSLFAVNMGSNDFLNNYFAPFSPIGNLSAEAVNSLILSTLEQQLTRLYSLGARKFVIASVGPLGCIPYRLTFTFAENGECDQKMNLQIQSFNAGLEGLLNQLNSQLSGSVFVYANAYDKFFELIQNPTEFGFTVSNVACCGAGGEYRGALSCSPLVNMCNDRGDYVFWDPYHPSDKANVVLATTFYYGDTNYVRPMNVAQLAAMQI